MKKGFTLIELLAVIIVLGIIALIAVPKISDSIEKASKGAAETSAKHYFDALNNVIAMNEIDDDPNNNITNGIKNVGDIPVSVKGELPESGTIEIQNAKVKSMVIAIKGYTVTCDVKGKCTGEKGIVENKTYVYYASVGNGLTSLDDQNKLTEPPTNRYAYLKYEVKNNSLEFPQVCLNVNSTENCINYNDFEASTNLILSAIGFDDATWDTDQDENYIRTYGDVTCYLMDSFSTECYTSSGGVYADSAGAVRTYALGYVCRINAGGTVECATY